MTNDRLQTLELENSSLREEATRCRTHADKVRTDKSAVEEKLCEAESVVACLQEEITTLREQERRLKECVLANQQVSIYINYASTQGGGCLLFAKMPDLLLHQ